MCMFDFCICVFVCVCMCVCVCVCVCVSVSIPSYAHQDFVFFFSSRSSLTSRIVDGRAICILREDAAGDHRLLESSLIVCANSQRRHKRAVGNDRLNNVFARHGHNHFGTLFCFVKSKIGKKNYRVKASCEGVAHNTHVHNTQHTTHTHTHNTHPAVPQTTPTG